ncbi:MAG: hypothetical protein U5Q03_01210 [Bacteroidota bacterium]|nr:hypothetical protein [Bacteroidota bacterium]
MPDMVKLGILFLVVFLLNLPFGYWRDHVKRFGWQWYLAIHLPVPLIVMIRLLSHIGWHWTTFMFFVTAFFLGQWIGSRIHKKQQHRHPDTATACMLMDLYRNI